MLRERMTEKMCIRDRQRYGSEMQKIFKEFEIKELIPTPEQIKDIFNSRLRNEEQPEGICFMQEFDEFVSERRCV